MTVAPTLRSFFVGLCLVVAALVPEGASAQQALQSETAQPAPQAATAQTEPQIGGYLGQSRSEYAVFVFGDSLAAGLWAGSQRVIKGNRRLRVKGRFKEDSGLGRPRNHDWVAAIPKIIERNPMDIAVVLIGTNDGRSVRLDGGRLEFGSEEWAKYYAGRVDDVIRILKANKIAVYWVELPPMGSAKHDEAVKRISQIHRERLAVAGMRFVEIRKEFANADDTYTNQGLDVNGTLRRLRARNGIQFLKNGNTKLAKLVVDAIIRDIEVSDGVREPDPELALGPGSADEKPIFGHSLSSGEAFVLSRAELPKPDAVSVARRPTKRSGVTSEVSTVLTGEAVIKNLRATAVPGSAAANLFINGEWPEAPAGRVDDFNWTGE